MRILLLILILLVVAAIAAIATGFLDISQTRPARAPDIETENGIRASGGQTPAFDVETGSISVREQNVTVAVPTVGINPADQAGAGNAQAPVANSQ